jgi:hypothetical protein
MPVRIMIDTQIYDTIAIDGSRKRLIESCQRDGLIQIKSTHIEAGELSKIPAIRDIGQATAVNTERVGSGVFVLGHSRLDEDRFGTPETNSAFAAIQKGNVRHTEDAMIGATALIEVDILVTDDNKFRKKFITLNSTVKTMSSDEFFSYLSVLSTSSPKSN